MAIKANKMQTTSQSVCRICLGKGHVQRDTKLVVCMHCRGTGKSGQYQTKG